MQTTNVQQASENQGKVLGEVRSAPTSASGTTNGDRALLEALADSKLYHDYERAFSEATGLPVALRSVESWQLPLHGKRHENPFCEMMALKSKACAACLQVSECLAQRGAREPQTVTCAIDR